jgi:hypothetical protein
MRITIHATIENDGGLSPSHAIPVGEITRDPGVDPASGLGLFVRETNALLRQIQTVVLNEQEDEFIRIAAERAERAENSMGALPAEHPARQFSPRALGLPLPSERRSALSLTAHKPRTSVDH